MKYIKIYEYYNSEYDFSLLKIDIEGIFVEVKDLGYKIFIFPSIDKNYENFLIEINAPVGIDITGRDRVLVRECIKMCIDYLKYKCGDIIIRYKYYTRNSDGSYAGAINARTLLLDDKYSSRINNHVYKIEVIVKIK
jgi:hypothetical protein